MSMKRKKDMDSSENWSHKHDFPISETWNTDNTLAQLIVPRLLAFKALDKHGHPEGMKDMREWNDAIQKMIDAFELMKYVHTCSKEENQVVEQGLDLFRKYFRHVGLMPHFFSVELKN